MVPMVLNDEARERVALLLKERNIATAERVHGSASPRDTMYMRVGKRAADIVFASVALVVTAPINLVLAIGTYLDVGRPILFLQERAGKDGVPFTLVKFRNMTNETDEDGNLLPPDQRVTKWGRFVRRTSLDELLNFWSILKGDMSVIGPRPLLPEYTERYCSYHRARLAVRPGLECPPDPTLDDPSSWEGHLNGDVWYAENVSALTDIKKFMRIVEAVFDPRSTFVRGAAGRSWFMGYDDEGHAVCLTDLPESLLQEALEGDADA